MQKYKLFRPNSLLFQDYFVTLHYHKPSFMKGKLILAILATAVSLTSFGQIDRKALVERNNPHITSIDPLSSLSVGNGEFAFTADVTGLQTFYQYYRNGVPLGTMSQWGWHSFPNTEDFNAKEVLKASDFGKGHEEWYSCQFKTGREKDASDWLRANPHRLHLGQIGFDNMIPGLVSDVNQILNLWEGLIESDFKYKNTQIKTRTSCNPDLDMIAVKIDDPQKHNVRISFAYPSGQHSDDGCDWEKTITQLPEIIQPDGYEPNVWLIKRTIDDTIYYIKVCLKNAEISSSDDGSYIIIKPRKAAWEFTAEFSPAIPDGKFHNVAQSEKATKTYWQQYWTNGAAVDFSHCTDPRAKKLERRVVLSQYLTAIQCAGSTPPQETGLTYNSWFGKFHLEMIWWHQAHFALWNHPEKLAHTLEWYFKAQPMAEEIARRQGFKGVRWMKMTDPDAAEAPSNTGSFLIWQQPHIIYLAELVYRQNHSQDFLQRFYPLIENTALFMADFLVYDPQNDRFIIKGAIPAQETLKASETINPPFELSYWHFGLCLAQKWRERMGMERNKEWDEIIEKLSPLASKDGIYAAAESAESYVELQKTVAEHYETDGQLLDASELKGATALFSDHMAVLAAYGMLPECPLMDKDIMLNTLNWVLKNWNWDKTWGWDYPTTAMNATRLHQPEKAIEALLMDKRTNTFLPNGHNYQDSRLRCYLPGNGGLLTAIALMCAGWDGCEIDNPGFPKDGKWDVRWEGLSKMP